MAPESYAPRPVLSWPGAGWSRAPTACSVPGALRQRERAESEPCKRDPAEPAAGAENEDADGDAVLALLAAPSAPRVEAAFHCRLRRDAAVERRALHELGVYYLVSSAGRAGPDGSGRDRARGTPAGLGVTVRAPRSPTPRAPSAAALA